MRVLAAFSKAFDGQIITIHFPDRLLPPIRDNLAVHSERMGFTPSVVGLDLEDISRLARDDDPWWSSVVKDAIVLGGRRPEELPSLAGTEVHG
ncbi:hypothetical protein [Mesorhizobium abyssinicae]|uniref:hypothetical protein n=1 Tax=Mesorhizobium abyssinicae TaxID=1209958 RepID=UPI003CED2B81